MQFLNKKERAAFEEGVEENLGDRSAKNKLIDIVDSVKVSTLYKIDLLLFNYQEESDFFASDLDLSFCDK